MPAVDEALTYPDGQTTDLSMDKSKKVIKLHVSIVMFIVCQHMRYDAGRIFLCCSFHSFDFDSL